MVAELFAEENHVGYADGEPVVSGLGWRTGRTIGVYSIATIPSARRRGYGAAMTARVVADGRRLGAQQTLDGEVFVQLFPTDSHPLFDQPPVLTLL